MYTSKTIYANAHYRDIYTYRLQIYLLTYCPIFHINIQMCYIVVLEHFSDVVWTSLGNYLTRFNDFSKSMLSLITWINLTNNYSIYLHLYLKLFIVQYTLLSTQYVKWKTLNKFKNLRLEFLLTISSTFRGDITLGLLFRVVYFSIVRFSHLVHIFP